LYAIGKLFALIQSPLFQSAVTRNTFTRRVMKISEPFYIVCGYGDTGQLIVQALVHQGTQCTVIEKDQARVNVFDLDEFPREVPRFHADCSDAEILARAGLKSAWCRGVVAVTRNDSVNLKVSITSKLLNPGCKVYCRAETHDTEANMASFGTDYIINPYDTFAQYLSTALVSPSRYLLNRWLSLSSGSPLSKPIFPPKGRWLLCGYGRFGKAVHKKLLAHGLPVTVIEVRPDLTDPPKDTIVARGTEAETLISAEIHKAVGIIAATDNDVNNLSILVTARQLKPDIFTIARQQSSGNTEIFKAANMDIVANHSLLIASRLMSLMTTPLTARFLESVQEQSEEWARLLVSRISGCVEDYNPVTWVMTLEPQHAPAFFEKSLGGESIKLQHLTRDPRNRKKILACVPLMLHRDGKDVLLPEDGITLQPHDRLLFAGNPRAKSRISYTVSTPEALHYTLTGTRPPSGTLWKWLSRRARPG
jgi:Trk K+ transport system NAD-binding subunit